MIPIRVSSPSETLKPAKSITASLGIGMQADSNAISRKTAGSPVELMKSVAALTIGLSTTSVKEARISTREVGPASGGSLSVRP